MAAHLADILRKHVIVPVNPFVVIDVLAFTAPKVTTVNNAAAVLDFYRDCDMQAFMVHDSGHGIFRAVGRIVALADADQMEFFAGYGILADRMETESAHAIAPGDAAS